MENAMSFTGISLTIFVLVVNHFAVPLLAIFALSLMFDGVYVTSNSYWGTFLLFAVYNKWFTFQLVYAKPEEK
jgi:hypothetical protein